MKRPMVRGWLLLLTFIVGLGELGAGQGDHPPIRPARQPPSYAGVFP